MPCDSFNFDLFQLLSEGLNDFNIFDTLFIKDNINKIHFMVWNFYERDFQNKGRYAE